MEKDTLFYAKQGAKAAIVSVWAGFISIAVTIIIAILAYVFK